MQIIGHRGAMGLAQANTIDSILKALEYKVDGIELDVQVTQDKIPVLSSSRTLKGKDNLSYKINQINYDDLVKANLSIVQLDRVMDLLIDKKVKLLLEIKPKVTIDPIAAIIEKQIKNGWLTKNISISSRSFKQLKKFQILLPQIQLVVREPWSGVRASIKARRLKTKRINMQQKWLWSVYVKPLAKKGYKIYAYPLNNPKKAIKMSRYGLFGVITDYPNRFQNFTKD